MANKRKTKAKNRKKSAKRARVPTTINAGPMREVLGVVGIGLVVFTFLALLSLQIGNGHLMGRVGHRVAEFTYGMCGVVGYVGCVLLGWTLFSLLMEREYRLKTDHWLGFVIGALSISSLLHLIFGVDDFLGYGPGGLIGSTSAEFFKDLVSSAGAILVAVVGLLIAIVVATPLRFSQVIDVVLEYLTVAWQWIATGVTKVLADARSFLGEVVQAILPEKDVEEYIEEDDDYFLDDEESIEEEASLLDPPIINARESGVPEPVKAEDTKPNELKKAKLGAVPKAKKRRIKKSKEAVPFEAVDDNDTEAFLAEGTTVESGGEEEKSPLIVESKFKAAKAAEMKKKEKKAEKERLDFIPLNDGEYKFPPISLLDYDESAVGKIDRGAMLEMSAKLTKTLDNYGVKGEVAAIRPGPVVTMYEFSPAPGTRLNKIVNLGDDLAMSLEALKVRIVAPIPGKAAVGIEVPNKDVEMVYIKEIIADPTFRNPKFNLPMALGKDIEGAPATVDLSKMPHLLVAGTTGSGKSVSVNAMITSLLYSSSPEDVRMIMVDPKMLELSIYDGVPHLLLPVVTDPKKANIALRWAVDEMEQRYDLLAKQGVRDIASYNKKMERLAKTWEADALENAAKKARKAAEETEEDEDDAAEEEEIEAKPRKLPFIVVVIDEFADLMMCAPKEVETSVARIAQKARAAGIHLILATQRPSVDVITGLIKANFPSRIAFRVTSKVDSRTVLDQGGAEALLGSGDMLFSDRGSAPRRLHGCYVDEDEIHRLVEFLKTQGKPVYNLDILKPKEDDEDGYGGSSSKNVDAMYDKAVAIVAETQRVSVSYIQRRLSVGYNRAAKMVEQMEVDGVVSSPDNKKQREVLISAA